jgi:hypothetical protein
MGVRLKVLTAGLAAAATWGTIAVSAAAAPFTSRLFADGAKFDLSNPDDLTLLGNKIRWHSST